ncbi:MAG: hypothetical protein ACLQVD_10325 [Capsulimonadaceae bacterium]
MKPNPISLVVFGLATALMASATPSTPTSQHRPSKSIAGVRLTLTLRHATLPEAVAAISHAAGVRITLSDEGSAPERISIAVHNAALGDVLNALARQCRLHLELTGSSAILTPINPSSIDTGFAAGAFASVVQPTPPAMTSKPSMTARVPPIADFEQMAGAPAPAPNGFALTTHGNIGSPMKVLSPGAEHAEAAMKPAPAPPAAPSGSAVAAGGARSVGGGSQNIVADEAAIPAPPPPTVMSSPEAAPAPAVDSLAVPAAAAAPGHAAGSAGNVGVVPNSVRPAHILPPIETVQDRDMLDAVRKLRASPPADASPTAITRLSDSSFAVATSVGSNTLISVFRLVNDKLVLVDRAIRVPGTPVESTLTPSTATPK